MCPLWLEFVSRHCQQHTQKLPFRVHGGLCCVEAHPAAFPAFALQSAMHLHLCLSVPYCVHIVCLSLMFGGGLCWCYTLCVTSRNTFADVTLFQLGRGGWRHSSAAAARLHLRWCGFWHTLVPRKAPGVYACACPTHSTPVGSLLQPVGIACGCCRSGMSLLRVHCQCGICFRSVALALGEQQWQSHVPSVFMPTEWLPVLPWSDDSITHGRGSAQLCIRMAPVRQRLPCTVLSSGGHALTGCAAEARIARKHYSGGLRTLRRLWGFAGQRRCRGEARTHHNTQH